jgi:hypothetical protein
MVPMPMPVLAALLGFWAPTFDFHEFGPYDSAVPKVETTLGYSLGIRITTYYDQERVVLGIASKAGSRVRVTEFGKSVQGRPLRVIAISSPKNIQNLNTIREAHQKLARGEDVDLSKLPTLVWINQSIHGNEPASFESAMMLIYNLAASRNARITKILDESVVLVNPVYNPDGHERFGVYYNSIARGGSAPSIFEQQEPSLIHGRTNQYRFDMNRDRVAFSQDETRQEFAEFLKWSPQIYVDQHGQVGTYFFPPEPMSINQNVDRDRNHTWTEVIGQNIGREFDKKGFQYYVKDAFDLYVPGYLDSSTTLSGAIGMTHETDGGKYIAARRGDGSVLTLRRGIEKHFTSALAVADAAAQNRLALLQSAASFKKKVVSGEAAGKFQRVVVTNADPRPLKRLADQLGRAGIKSKWAQESFTQEDANNYWTGKRGKAEFPAGSLIVDMNQPQGAFAKALLEPGQNFEKEFIEQQVAKKKSAPDGETYPGPDESEFYDITGWSLPFSHSLQASWCESRATVRTSDALDALTSKEASKSSIGYAIAYQDQDDILAVHDILAAGVKGSITNKPMKLGGQSYSAGTFLFLADRNEDGYEAVIFDKAKARGVSVEGLLTSYPSEDRYGPGSGTVQLLQKPKIGVVFGSGSNLASVSGTWFAFDRVFKLPFDALSTSALSGNLSEYTAIIVPPGANASTSDRLKDWVRSGGRLIVLEDLGWALGPSGFVSLDRAKAETQSLPGTLFRANVDARSTLSYGYPRGTDGKVEIGVPIAGSSFFSVRKEGGSVVTLPNEKTSKLLSGWAWPDESEKAISNTIFLQDAPFGRGHAYLFTWEPTDRAMWPGLHKLLLNAILL